MINIEYFASKMRREHYALYEEVSAERFVPPRRFARTESKHPELEAAS